MDTTVKGYSVIVVSQSDKLNRMSRAAVEKLGTQLTSGRAVKAEAKRFAAKIAAKPSTLRLEVFDVAGLSGPTIDQPGEREPIVLQDGKFVPVSHTYLMVAGEHHVVASKDLNDTRDEIVRACVQRIAEDIFLGDAMMEAIGQADPDGTLESMSTYSATCTVDLYPDDGGEIAKRLPKWIRVKTDDDRPKS